MSFVGDLEHLPIVDVIQLLHATRKSGTLCLKSNKGESQLVFSDGCIVSANHSNNSVRIGQILVQMNAISREELDKTLLEQKSAGSKRIPLIAALIEGGKIRKEDAFKGLETLIEMTIVEVLTWTEGTFELDVETTVVSDEYRYIPEKLKLDLQLNTQNVLMDALRIYDEKKRDGTLMDDTFPTDDLIERSNAPSDEESPIISIDDLGLDVLDDLEKVIPGFFTPVKVHDPTMVHRDKLGAQLARLTPGEQENLLSFLVSLAEPQTGSDLQKGSPHAVVLFSADEYISHTVITVCKHDGLFTFSTDEEENLGPIIDQSLNKKLHPVLVIDQTGTGPDRTSEDRCRRLVTQMREHYPDMSLLLLAPPECFDATLSAMKSGVRAVLPKPDLNGRRTTFVQDSISFLDALKQSIRHIPVGSGHDDAILFNDCMNTLSGLKELGEITAILDRYAAGTLVRSVTFTLRKSELIAEKLVTSPETLPINISLSAHPGSPVGKVLDEGVTYFGQLDDPALERALYPAIGRPASGHALLLPLKCLGRVLAITYADFGTKPPSTIPFEQAEILARHAGIVYENSLYRKKFEQMLQAKH